MRQPNHLILRPQPHPDPAVDAGGFELTHTYLRECWAPVLGQPATTLLERLPAMWRGGHVAGFDRAQLAEELGLGRSRPWAKPLERTLDRLVEFGFAEWAPFVDRGVPTHDRGELGIYSRVSPLGDLDLERVTPAVRAKHDELAGPVLDRAFPSGPIDVASTAERSRYFARRLDAPSRSRTRDAIGL